MNQLEEVMKKKYLMAIGSWHTKWHIILTTIQNRQIKAILMREVFFGTTEKYPVISTNTLTPTIEKPSKSNAPNDMSFPKD